MLRGYRMSLSKQVVKSIKAEIMAMTPEQRSERLTALADQLNDLSATHQSQGSFTAAQEQEFYEAIEMAVRIEGFDSGRGFTWRALRRLTMKRAFLSPAP